MDNFQDFIEIVAANCGSLITIEVLSAGINAALNATSGAIGYEILQGWDIDNKYSLTESVQAGALGGAIMGLFPGIQFTGPINGIFSMMAGAAIMGLQNTNSSLIGFSAANGAIGSSILMIGIPCVILCCGKFFCGPSSGNSNNLIFSQPESSNDLETNLKETLITPQFN